MQMKQFLLDDHIRSPKDKYPFDPLKDAVGKGSYGIVYKAIAQSTGNPVAIKHVNFQFCSTPEEIEQTIFEAQFLEQMNHSHIVKVFDIEITKNYMQIIMELCKTNLDKYLSNNPEPDLKDVRRWLWDLLSTCYYLKMDWKVVHRDINPGNILITDIGTVKFCDIGITKNVQLTMALPQHTFIGSVFFMSPEVRYAYEQGKAKETIAYLKADMFSLGLTILKAVNFGLFQKLNATGLFNKDEALLTQFFIENQKSPTRKLDLITLGVLKAMLSFDVAERPSISDIWELINIQVDFLN